MCAFCVQIFMILEGEVQSMSENPMRIEPLSPQEAERAVIKLIPSCIIECINNLILDQIRQRGGTEEIEITLSELWTELGKHIDTEKVEEKYFQSTMVDPTCDMLFLTFDVHALDFPVAYKSIGWKVNREAHYSEEVKGFIIKYLFTKDKKA